MRNPMRLCLAGLLLAFSSQLSHVHSSSSPPAVDSVGTLAARIDHHVNRGLEIAGVKPAPRGDDAEFMRRAYLDITGRIPRSREVYEFLGDKSPDKRRKLVDDLLARPRYVTHFTNVWRALWIPETAANPRARYFQPGFEAWLRERIRANVGYDCLVRELLTTPISNDPAQTQPVLVKPGAPNPLAFFAVKDGKPENLAAASARLFLGVQIECAQCHDHPFARWQREQFWSQAAFFAGIERQGDSLFNPLREDLGRRELGLPNSNRKVSAAFLDQSGLHLPPMKSPRIALANWITAADNPFFAKAAVNRVWSRFFGVGIVEPVDDFNNANKPSHPELLDELARAFVQAKFDIRFLVRAICASEAYQRTSAVTDASQNNPRLFARMNVKGLTGEQLFDSLALAIGYRDQDSAHRPFEINRGTPRSEFLSKFGGGEAQTSVRQALTLMNGSLLAEATSPERSESLSAIIAMPSMKTAERIEAMFVATLGRKPTSNELELLVGHVEGVSKSDQTERLADVFWALLNSAEFRFNH